MYAWHGISTIVSIKKHNFHKRAGALALSLYIYASPRTTSIVFKKKKKHLSQNQTPTQKALLHS